MNYKQAIIVWMGVDKFFDIWIPKYLLNLSSIP